MFSGAGGLSLGFKQTGKINIVAAAENNPNARKTYKRNFAEVKRLYPDVRTIDYNELKEAVGQVDIVIGGPPCQGFSNANRQHSTIISMNNRLVKEYVRAICELQPTAFVMENVAMLKSQVHRFFLEENDMTNAKILNTTMYPNCFRYVHRDFAPVVVLEHTQAQGQRSMNLIWIEPQEETEGHCNW